ncbi:hypothetical protein Pelo_14898 [Pelomyxa schiedti]|nr:hypothetical protein Pelo_14898 [Pelomyxa schiedti]
MLDGTPTNTPRPRAYDDGPRTAVQHERLPDLIATGIYAREQLLSLAMSSHARCGASSPACGFTSMSAVATSPLWDWCLNLTEVTFGICVENSIVGRAGVFGMYLRLGVSSALNGITWIDRPIKCRQDMDSMGDIDQVWYKGAVDIDHVILGASNRWKLNFWFGDLRNGTWRKLEGGPEKFGPSAQGRNGRWWMRCCFDLSGYECNLTVHNLLDGDCGGVRCGVINFPEVKVWCTGLLFNNSAPDDDEAVIFFEDTNDLTLVRRLMDAPTQPTPNKRRRADAPHNAPTQQHELLPDLIATGLKAREQLLALATSSHARCGARSPARAFMSLSAAATSPLWDWCLTLTEVTFGICVEFAVQNVWVYHMYIRMGVSASLNSVTWIKRPIKCRGGDGRPVRINETGQAWYQGAVDIDHVLATWSTAPAVVPELWVVDLRTGSARDLTERYPPIMRRPQGGNRKWWIRCARNAGGGCELTVYNLLDSKCCGVQCGCVEFQQLAFCVGLLFDKGAPDEAAILFDSFRSDPAILVFDVSKTYAAKNPVVLGRAKWYKPKRSLNPSGFVMRTKAGKRVFFVEVFETGYGHSVFKFEEGCDYDSPKAFSTGTSGLSQLSSSLLCVAKNKTVEVWDCNSESTEPLRVITKPGLSYNPVIAESGFLFHQSITLAPRGPQPEFDALKVTDSLGNVVVTLKWPHGMWQLPSECFSVSGFM